MQNLLHNHKNLSTTETKKEPSDKEVWKEYSVFHDSFAELLSYENNRKCHSDIWQLNYI